MTGNFRKYMKGIQILRDKTPHSLSAILATINHIRQEEDKEVKKIHHYNDLPDYMEDETFLNLFLDVAKEMMADNYSDTFNEFSQIIGIAGSSKQLVRDFMERIPDGTTLSPQNTFDDMLDAFRKMPEGARYLLVVDSGKLIGLMSVVDFENHRDKIKLINRNTPVSDIPFLNKKITTLSIEEKMEKAERMFAQIKASGKHITKILVVDNYERPIGYLDERGMSIWRLENL